MSRQICATNVCSVCLGICLNYVLKLGNQFLVVPLGKKELEKK